MAFVRNNNNNRRHNNNFNNNRHRHNNNQGQNSQNGQRRHVNRINQVFESNGPDGRIRGTAQQIVEKYITLSRDVGMSGDRVLSQNYLQHAEHYQRLLNEITEENAIFEKEREATRQAQQSQPDLSPEAAAEGFIASEAVQEAGEQPPHSAAQRPERGPRPMRQPRPERQEQRPADDIPDNELPSFLHVPIKEGKPEENAAGTSGESPRRTLRPRRTASPAPSLSDEETANTIADGPSDE